MKGINIGAKLKEYTNIKSRAGELAIGFVADKQTNEMRAKAPWIDRTGFARSSIHNEISKDNVSIVASIGIGMDYGKYLELAHEKRFAIVEPTLMKNRSLILDEIGRIIDIGGIL